MPLRFCHPNTQHRKLRMPEWFVSSLMMDRALDAVVRRVKKLDREHDIPYLAGYSKDGKTIYIDRHMPSSFRYAGKDINTDRRHGEPRRVRRRPLHAAPDTFQGPPQRQSRSGARQAEK